MKKKLNLRKYKKYLPTALTGTACLGVLATTIFAHKNTLKDCELQASGKDLSKKDQFIIYLPTLISGVITVGVIIFNHKYTKSQLLAVSSAAAMSSTMYADYRRKAKEVLGDEQFNELERRMAEDVNKGIIQTFVPNISGDSAYGMHDGYKAEDGETLFYEPFLKSWFRSSKEAVRTALYHLNRNMSMGGVATIHDFYKFLGMEIAEDFLYFGWGFQYIEDNGYAWIDCCFTEATREDDGENYYILDWQVMPEFIEESRAY